jgi:hypothetical protein
MVARNYGFIEFLGGTIREPPSRVNGSKVTFLNGSTRGFRAACAVQFDARVLDGKLYLAKRAVYRPWQRRQLLRIRLLGMWTVA